MKKILLIGKLNRGMQNLNDCLSKKFIVQVCSESLDLIKGMIKISKPDMIIISAIELNGAETEIFDYLWKSRFNLKVLVIGTKDECSAYQGYFENEQFEHFSRPVSKHLLIKKCCECMNIPESDEETEKQSSEKKEKKKLILVVDDSSLALRSTKAMLEQTYQVIVATSGKKALETIEKRRPDLILLDYEMPDWDGRVTLEKIRENETMKNIPVIFLTAVAEKDHIAAVLRLKPVGYFLKPLEKEKVLKAIKEVFKGENIGS